MSDLLRECPFCEGEARKFMSHALKCRVFCIKCAATLRGETIAEAIAAWNTRSTSEREVRLVDALNELRSCSRAKIGMEDDFACADKQMRDALAAYQAGTGAVDAWMPIETAPKDGTIILVAHRHSGEESLYESLRSSIGGTTDDGVYRCLWGGFQDMGDGDYWPDWWCMDEPSENWEYPLNPIAWMPLPASPAKRDECPNGCVDGVIVMTGNTTLDRPRSCPIHGPKSGEGA